MSAVLVEDDPRLVTFTNIMSVFPEIGDIRAWSVDDGLYVEAPLLATAMYGRGKEGYKQMLRLMSAFLRKWEECGVYNNSKIIVCDSVVDSVTKVGLPRLIPILIAGEFIKTRRVHQRKHKDQGATKQDGIDVATATLKRRRDYALSCFSNSIDELYKLCATKEQQLELRRDLLSICDERHARIEMLANANVLDSSLIKKKKKNDEIVLL